MTAERDGSAGAMALQVGVLEPFERLPQPRAGGAAGVVGAGCAGLGVGLVGAVRGLVALVQVVRHGVLFRGASGAGEGRSRGGPPPMRQRLPARRPRAAGEAGGVGSRPRRRPGRRAVALPGPPVWGAASPRPVLRALVGLSELPAQLLALLVRQRGDHAFASVRTEQTARAGAGAAPGGQSLPLHDHRPHSGHASSAITGRCRVRTG